MSTKVYVRFISPLASTKLADDGAWAIADSAALASCLAFCAATETAYGSPLTEPVADTPATTGSADPMPGGSPTLGWPPGGLINLNDPAAPFGGRGYFCSLPNVAAILALAPVAALTGAEAPVLIAALNADTDASYVPAKRWNVPAVLP
jgi:hypothetical protein